MPYGMYLSAAGAHVQGHRLEVLSHNLANVNTPAFKPSLAILQARHNKAIDDGESSPGLGSLADIGGGVRIQPSETQFGIGPMEATGGKTDFAINDPSAFFVVQHGDEQLLTRAGAFQFDAAGRLITPAGDPVLGTDNNPIQIDPSLPYQVHHDGSIQQGGARLQMMLTRPKELDKLTREGANLFRNQGELENVLPNERKVVAGHIEKSAVNPTTAMMELIEASRAYESNLRLIQHQDQAYGNLIGRVLRE
jgi:flagellar basal-body rod protein FlgF